MTNETVSTRRNSSLMVRWIIATSIVLLVGLAGFVLRGDHEAKRSRPPHQMSKRAVLDDSTGHDDEIAFPEIPDVPDVDLDEFGQQSTASEPAANFAACDESPHEVGRSTPDSWTTYVTSTLHNQPIEFAHPADWSVDEQGEQLIAISPKGDRAFVAQTMPVGQVSIRDLFSTMAAADSAKTYSSVRAVVVGGTKGCTMTVSGEGHSGEMVALQTQLGVTVITAARQLNPDDAEVAESWALISSVRLGA